ncbi:MAG: hypothetical protein AB7F19_07655 [Candidatus Babeliales bacterium]
MTDNVIYLENADLPAEKVLKAAIESNYQHVVIIGFDESSNKVTLQSTNPDGCVILGFIEIAKYELLKNIDYFNPPKAA